MALYKTKYLDRLSYDNIPMQIRIDNQPYKSSKVAGGEPVPIEALKNGKVVRRFDTITEAAKFIGWEPKRFSSALNHNNEIGGYTWRRLDHE